MAAWTAASSADGVGDLGQALLFDQRAGRLAGLVDGGQELAGGGDADHAVVDQANQLGQMAWLEGVAVCVGGGQARDVVLDPVGGFFGVGASSDVSFEQLSSAAVGGQPLGVVGAQAERVHVARSSRVWQLGQARAQLVEPGALDKQRRQVRLGEVAVVVRFFF